MKVIFDQGVPAPLRHMLADHEVETAIERGWDRLSDGDLLSRAEEAGFEVLVTTDQNLRNQQRLSGRRLAVIVLLTTSWPTIKPQATRVLAVASAIESGDYREVSFDRP